MIASAAELRELTSVIERLKAEALAAPTTYSPPQCHDSTGHCGCVDGISRLIEHQYAVIREADNMLWMTASALIQTIGDNNDLRRAFETVRRSANANARRVGVIGALPTRQPAAPRERRVRSDRIELIADDGSGRRKWVRSYRVDYWLSRQNPGWIRADDVHD